jgi:hypothetical protein
MCTADASGIKDVCTPKHFEGLVDTLYFSNGDGTFRDGSQAAGLVPNGKGLGVVAADVDKDFDLDLYVANDTTDNFLYINDGLGVFREMGLISGSATDDNGVPNGSMGVCVFDYDQDLEPDILVTNYENETMGLYRNLREGSFVHVSKAAGLEAIGKLFVSWGCAAADLDCDGDEDVLVANGHAMYYPRTSTGPQSPLLLANTARGRFERVEFPPESYFSQQRWGRGLIASDLDRDGDLDLVFSNNNEPAVVLGNESKLPKRSVFLRLIGTRSHRDAVGAIAILRTSTGDYMRLVSGGGSYMSSGEYSLHFGLPSEARVHEATIYWPRGTTQTEQRINGPGFFSVVEIPADP